MAVWLITGASNGLGLILSIRALRAGHNVIAAMRNPSRSADAARSVEAAGGKVFQLDTTDSQAVLTQKIHEAEKLYGQIDVLVNNAGYSTLGPAEKFSEAEIGKQFQTNVYGPMYLSQAVLPAMRARRAGTIINVSSVAGQDASPACALYASSKFALEGWTEALAKEVDEFGISVLIVEPGAFRTNFLGAMNVSENYPPSSTSDDDPYRDNVASKSVRAFQAADGKQAGDPEKAADRMIEYATGEGAAGQLKGRVLRMVLGRDAYLRIEKKTQKLHEDMALGRDVAFGTDL